MKKKAFSIKNHKLISVLAVVILIVGLTMFSYSIKSDKKSVQTKKTDDSSKKIASQGNTITPQTKVSTPTSPTTPQSSSNTRPTTSASRSVTTPSNPVPVPTQCDLQRPKLYDDYNKKITTNSSEHKANLAYLQQLWDEDEYGDDYGAYQEDVDFENEEFHKDALVIYDDYVAKQRAIGCNV